MKTYRIERDGLVVLLRASTFRDAQQAAGRLAQEIRAESATKILP